MFEYLLPDGTALPENEVIKLAVQKGLTADDYVKKNKLTLRPKQKKVEVKKEVTKPVTKEVAKPTQPEIEKAFGKTEIEDPLGIKKMTSQDLNGDAVIKNIKKWEKKPKLVGPIEKEYEPVSIKKDKIGDYLTSSLRTEKAIETAFTVEEEEGSEFLKTLYAGIPNLTFEQTDIVSDQMPIFDAVKAVYTDPITGKRTESSELEFDITPIKGQANTRNAKTNKNADILKDFFNKNLKTEDLSKNKYLQDITKLNYNKQVAKAITPEFRAKVNEEFEAPDLFATVKETYKGTSAGGGLTMGTAGGGSYTIKPYEQELNNAKRQILKETPKISKEELQIKAERFTRDLLKTKAINDKKVLVSEEIISKDPSMQANMYVGSLLAKKEAVDVQNKSSVKLKIAETKAIEINGLATDSVDIFNGVPKSEAEAAAMVRRFAKVGIVFDPLDSEIVTLKNGTQVNKGFLNAYNQLKEQYKINQAYAASAFKEQQDNLPRLADSDIFANAASKNYDLSEKYLTNVGVGFSDLAVGGAYFTAKVLDIATPFSYAGDAISKMIYGKEAETASERLDKWAVNYTNAATDIRNSYTRDVSFDDAFSSGSNFGKFAAQEITSQIPILVAMVASGGAATAVVGVTSAGTKMADMQTEIASGEASYSKTELWLKSIGYGGAEAGFSALTTIPILKRAKISLGRTSGVDVIDNSMKAYFKEKTPGFVFDQFLESSGEIGTQMTQNIIDGRPVMENTAHAGFSGFAMGTVISGVPYTKGLYLSAFSDYNSKEGIRNLEKDFNDLGKKFEASQNPEEKKALGALMDEKAAERDLAIEKQQKLINNNLRAGVAQSIIFIEGKKAKLQNRAKEVLDDKNIKPENKELIIKSLRKEFDKFENAKQKALDPSNMMQDLSQFKVLEVDNPDRYNDLIDRAKTQVGADMTVKPDDDKVQKAAYDLYLKQEIDINIENAGKVEGAKITSFETKKEAIDYIKANKDLSDINKAEAIYEINEGADGFNAEGVGQVLVKENMFANQRTQIATHEVGHYVTDLLLKNNPEAFVPIANQLLLTTKKLDNALYKKLLETTERDANGNLKATEVVSRFLELVSKGDISFAEKSKKYKGLAGLFGSMVQKTYPDVTAFDFKGETDMYNFVVGLGKKISAGTLTMSDIAAGSESGAVKLAGSLAVDKKYTGIVSGTETEVGFSKAKVDEIQKKIDNLEDQLDTDEIDYDTYENRLKIFNEELKKAKLEPEVEKPEVKKPKAAVTEEEVVREIIKNEKGTIASDKVQKIYDEKGEQGANEIIKLFKPITAKIVAKRRDAPGFNEEELTKEIELGAGGLFDLIRKFDASKGVPLAAYINKNLPLRAITASRRVLDKEFTSDVETEVNVRATETADQGMTINVPEKPKYKNALESKVLSPEALETANKKILPIVRTLKSRIDVPVTLNRTVTPLIAEIRDEVGRQLDIDIKTMLGGKKDGVFRKELLRNKRYILENMTTTWLMGKDGQGGIPQAIQKKVNGQWVSFPSWVGQKVDRETMSTDLAGRTSGAELVRRIPSVFNNVSDVDFLGQFIGPDGNPIRGRKESGSKAMAEEIAFDIINADFANGGPILQAFEANQERLGVEMASVAISEFLKQSERGNIKFSKSIAQRLNEGQAELAANISVKGKGNLSNVRLALINTFPDWTKAEIEGTAIKLTPSITMAFKQFKFNKKEIPKDKLTKAIANVANYADDGTIMRNKFGSAISVAEFFSKPDNRTDLKTLDLAFMEAVIEKYGKDEAIDLLTSLWGPTVAGKTGKGKAAPVSIYNGIEDFNKSILGIQNNTGDGKIVDSKQTYKKNNSIFKNHFDGTFDKTKDETKSAKAKELSIFAAEWFSKKILDPGNDYGNEHLAAIYTLLIKENNSVLRSAAPVAGVIKDKRIKNIKKYDYDHSKPVSYIARRLADKYVYGQDVDLEALFKDYEVTIIPKTISTKLAKQGMQSMMPLDYTEGSGAGIRISKATLQTVERYAEFIDSSSGNQVAKANAIANSYSKSSKGISVFDFDDTVGLTKGSVLYTMPDGSKGKLNAEEFAKEGSSFLEQGAVFDFSEFSKVVGGKPGPMVEKMKKMIGKFGPENFFILTARPANAAGPIHEFLSSIGIDIPLENITGLGNSTAQAKADWMTAKAAEGYNDFYFADDAIQNVEAVKKALNIPGVDSKIQRALIKFSLTSKQDLKWDMQDWGSNVFFNVNNKEYAIVLTNTGEFGYSNNEQKILDNLIKKYNLEDEEANLLGSYEGGTLNLVFGDENQSVEITGARDAFEVFGTVVNGVLDYIKKNGTTAVIFTAKESSRKKLYNSMATIYADKLGWNAFYEDGVYIISKYPIKETVNSFNSQSKQVKDVLNVIDVKSEIQQARLKFSKTLNSRFNDILQENVGLDPKETFSDILAKRKGTAIGKYRFFVPPSAADFELLLYDFLGRGKVGERQYKFFTKALLEPYSNGIALIDAAKQSIKNDYLALKKAFPDVNKNLGKLTPDGNFTYDQALRVSMWNSMGVEIPGLDKSDITSMVNFVNNDASLSAFKAGLIATGRQGTGWIEPSEYWDAETIISDLHNITEKVGRKKYLTEFIDNSKEIFTPENLNRIEVIYGSNFREALEDSIYRMTNGTNRESGTNRLNAAWLNWINNSTAAIMFFNTKSAILQTVGSINYLNWRENNPLNAAKAFANQPQYWKDFAMIFNSDKIKERRSGLKEDVTSAEIANAAEGSKNKASAVISYLLKKGFMPTQIADSFAIAMGGASFYRNKVNAYLKQGMELDEAEAQAWKDFSKVTDETQQSGDPRDISQQQASTAGRLVLAFQNTPMQQARLIKKSALDLINGRGDAKTHISKIVYYTAVQNIIFGSLQSALFTLLFDDDDEEDKKKKTAKDKWLEIGNGTVDTLLRGSGIGGAIVATLKNVAKRYLEEKEKGFKADYGKVLIEAANIAPPIGSKFQKAFGAMRTAEFEKDVIKERGWSVTQNGRLNLSPAYSVLGQVVEAGTNLPVNRFVTKVNNVSEALDSRNKSWQRIALALGYKPYAVGAKDEEGDIIKAEAKTFRKEEGKIKARETREMTRDSLNKLPLDEFKAYVLKKKNDRLREHDSIRNLPKPKLDKYLKDKALAKEFSDKQKDMLKIIKLDSLIGLSKEEYNNYLQVVENKKEIAKIDRKLKKLKEAEKRDIYK